MNPPRTNLHELAAEGPPATVEYEFDAETPASIAVVQAICVLEDVDPLRAPTELGFVLHEHVDPDALDTLLADGSGTGETVLSFEISNGGTYAVEIVDTGRVTVRDVS